MPTQPRRAEPAQRDAVWRALFQRQEPRLRGAMCSAFLDGLKLSGLEPGSFPDYDDLSRRLQESSGWRIEVVPGLMPVGDYFALLRERRFPATAWLRHPEQLEYTPEPDAFHDVFGHVPQLFVPELAELTCELAERAREATPHELVQLERLYWFTIEFGLVREGEDVRAYGAGLASSLAELQRALHAPEVRHVALAGDVAAASDFSSDVQQDVYAVAPSLRSLTGL